VLIAQNVVLQKKQKFYCKNKQFLVLFINDARGVSMKFKLLYLSTALCMSAYGCDDRCNDSFLDQYKKFPYMVENGKGLEFNIFQNVQVNRFHKETKHLKNARQTILRDMRTVKRTFDDTNEKVRVEMSNLCGSFVAFNADYKDNALSAFNISKQHMANYVDRIYSKEAWDIYGESRKKTYWGIARDFSWGWGDDNLLLRYSKFVEGPYMCGVEFAKDELRSTILKDEYSFDENLLMLELLSYSLGVRILALSDGDQPDVGITLDDSYTSYSNIHLVGTLGCQYRTTQEIIDSGIMNIKGTLYVHYSHDKNKWRVIPVENQPFTHGCDLCFDHFHNAIVDEKSKKHELSFSKVCNSIDELLFDRDED